jgi:hypothetical protein
MNVTSVSWQGSRGRTASMNNVTETLHTLVELLDRLSIDYDVMRRWASELDVSDQLEKALSERIED